MTSIREQIAQDIFETLEATRLDPLQPVRLKKVVREPIIIDEISQVSLPIVYLESSDEDREDISMGGSAITRQGTIQYVLVVYVVGNTRDSDRNSIIQVIDDALEVDRTRGGLAHWTEVVSIQNISAGEARPFASIRLTVEVTYTYTRGNS